MSGGEEIDFSSTLSCFSVNFGVDGIPIYTFKGPILRIASGDDYHGLYELSLLGGLRRFNSGFDSHHVDEYNSEASPRIVRPTLIEKVAVAG